MASRVTLSIKSLAVALLVAGFASTIIAQGETKRPPLRVPEMADTPLQLVPAGWQSIQRCD